MPDDSDHANHDTSSSSSDESATPLTCTGKRVRLLHLLVLERVRCEQCWVKNKQKKLRNAGKNVHEFKRGAVVNKRASFHLIKGITYQK